MSMSRIRKKYLDAYSGDGLTVGDVRFREEPDEEEDEEENDEGDREEGDEDDDQTSGYSV